MENFDKEDEEVMRWLEEEGALEWVGMDETGDRVMKLNQEKLKDFYPEVYDAMQEDLENQLMYLYDMGLVELSYDEDLVPIFRISPEGIELMKKYGYELENENDD